MEDPSGAQFWDLDDDVSAVDLSDTCGCEFPRADVGAEVSDAVLAEVLLDLDVSRDLGVENAHVVAGHGHRPVEPFSVPDLDVEGSFPVVDVPLAGDAAEDGVLVQSEELGGFGDELVGRVGNPREIEEGTQVGEGRALVGGEPDHAATSLR